MHWPGKQLQLHQPATAVVCADVVDGKQHFSGLSRSHTEVQTTAASRARSTRYGAFLACLASKGTTQRKHATRCREPPWQMQSPLLRYQFMPIRYFQLAGTVELPAPLDLHTYTKGLRHLKDFVGIFTSLNDTRHQNQQAKQKTYRRRKYFI